MKRLILISLMLFFSITCLPQSGKWKRAQKINTIESYQEFLVSYPESEYSDDAKLKLVELEFNKAKSKNTVDEFERFLAKYPQSEFAINAKNHIEELKKIEKNRIEELKKKEATLSSYEIGKTTYAQFKRDLDDGSWKTGNYSVHEYHKAEPGKSALEGKVIGSDAAITVIYASGKYCKLTFKGEGKIEEAILTAIEFIK